jgi:hypothetical protein
MQNDAKLGLLAGVIGVIVVATLSGKHPSALGTASGSPPAVAARAPAKSGDAAAPASLPVAAVSTTPGLRSKPDVQGSTTARRTTDEFDD